VTFSTPTRYYNSNRVVADRAVADQDFLNIWKDADPDIPILKQAKAERIRASL